MRKQVMERDTEAYALKRAAKLKRRIGEATADPNYVINGKKGVERVKPDQITLARWEQRLADIRAGQPIAPDVERFVLIRKSTSGSSQNVGVSARVVDLAEAVDETNVCRHDVLNAIEKHGRCDTDTHILIPLEPASHG